MTDLCRAFAACTDIGECWRKLLFRQLVWHGWLRRGPGQQQPFTYQGQMEPQYMWGSVTNVNLAVWEVLFGGSQTAWLAPRRDTTNVNISMYGIQRTGVDWLWKAYFLLPVEGRPSGEVTSSQAAHVTTAGIIMPALLQTWYVFLCTVLIMRLTIQPTNAMGVAAINIQRQGRLVGGFPLRFKR